MMMNRFKRFLSLICALSMLISIAGSYADPNEGDQSDPPAAAEPASEPEPAPAEEPTQEPEADEADDPEGDDPSDTDPSDEEPSGQEEPSGSEESSEDDSQPGGEQAADQREEHSDEEKPSDEEKTSGDKRNDPKQDESKTDEPQPDGSKQEDENQTPASEGEEKQASGSGNGENRESSDQTGTDHPSDADSADTQTAGQETSGSSDGSGTAEQGSPAENEAENKDAQASEQNVSDQNISDRNASGQNVSDQNPSGQNTPGQENAVQDTPSDPDENLNEAEEPEDDPEAEENEEDQTGLNVLEIGGSVKKGTVVPDEPIRLVMRSERTETVLLTVILAAGDEIRLAVNSRELNFAESTVDEENGEQTLIYPLEAKAGNAYLLEISAGKEIGFSIQAVYREAEAPTEEELPEREENVEQTEVRNDNGSDVHIEEPEESENSKNTNNQEPDEKEASSNIPELSIPENASITYDVFWDGEAAVGEVAHFVAVVTGMEDYNYQLQWQASEDNEKWFDLDNETGMKMDVLITNENCDLYWRVQMKVTGMIHSEKEIDSNLNEESYDNHDAGMSNEVILDESIPNEEKSDEKTETEVN